MSLARTFMQETGLEGEFEQFLQFIIKKFKLPQKDVLNAIREYKNRDVVHTPISNDDTSSPSAPTIKKIKRIKIIKKGDRYILEKDEEFVKNVKNPLLLSILKRETLGVDEYNHVRQFLKRENVPFEDVEQISKPVEKIKNLDAIIKKAQEEIDNNMILSESEKNIAFQQKTKLKLVKIDNSKAWDPESKYVFKLQKGSKPFVIGQQETKDSGLNSLTDGHKIDLRDRGWAF